MHGHRLLITLSRDLASSPFALTFEVAVMLQRIRKKKQRMICCREVAKPSTPCRTMDEGSECAACSAVCPIHYSIRLGHHPCKVLLLDPKGRKPIEGAVAGFNPSTYQPDDSLPLDVRLAWFALKFPRCRPIYPSRLGWFDTEVRSSTCAERAVFTGTRPLGCRTSTQGVPRPHALCRG